MKICSNLKKDNSNHHERFHNKVANISARYISETLWLFFGIGRSYTYVMNEFLTADQACDTVWHKLFGKTLLELLSAHFYASFGTFCVKIGQIFADNESWNIRICRFSNVLQRLIVTRKMDRFGCKSCPEEGKDVD